jgi:hypothetical protein
VPARPRDPPPRRRPPRPPLRHRARRTLLAAITRFYAERIFGPDRAALLAAIVPATTTAQALRNRIRARFTKLYAERTSLQNDLTTLEAATAEPADDPTLLDELPLLGGILTNGTPSHPRPARRPPR